MLERDYHTALHDPTLTCHRCDVVASEVSFTAGRPARPRSAAVCPTFCRKTDRELREVDFTDRNSSKREPSDIRCPHPQVTRPAEIPPVRSSERLTLGSAGRIAIESNTVQNRQVYCSAALPNWQFQISIGSPRSKPMLTIRILSTVILLGFTTTSSARDPGDQLTAALERYRSGDLDGALRRLEPLQPLRTLNRVGRL